MSRSSSSFQQQQQQQQQQPSSSINEHYSVSPEQSPERGPSSSLTSIAESTRQQIDSPPPSSSTKNQRERRRQRSRQQPKQQSKQQQQQKQQNSSSSSSLPSKSSSALIEPKRPRESWESAYVFAFIYRFTGLCHDLRLGLILRTVVDFENALENDPVESQEDDKVIGAGEVLQNEQEQEQKEQDNKQQEQEQPPPQEQQPQKPQQQQHQQQQQQQQPQQVVVEESDSRKMLREILVTFYDNLKVVHMITWIKWLPSFVDGIIERESKIPGCATLKWSENYLRTRKGGFWGLDWKEKLHLLRILVDQQLTYSPKVRAMIEENFEKSAPKVPKQNNNSSKSKAQEAPPPPPPPPPPPNPLLIKSLGLDRNVKTWWQIDDSSRLYCSGNPYKLNCTWEALCSSAEEMEELQKTLARDPADIIPPPAEEEGHQESPQSNGTKIRVKIPPMFKRASSRKSNSSPTKKVDRGIKFEWELTRAIDQVVRPNIEARNQEIQNLIEEKAKIEEREAKKRRKLELSLQAPPLTRSTPGYGVRSRLRSQVSKPDYFVDSVSVDRQFERELRRYEQGKSDVSDKPGSSRRKRELSQGGHEGSSERSGNESWRESQTGEDYEDESFVVNEDGEGDPDRSISNGRHLRKRRRGSKKPQPPVTQGERRSSRVKNQVVEEVQEEPKKAVVEEPIRQQTSAWSRSAISETSQEMDGSLKDQPMADQNSQTDVNGNVSVWSRGKLIYVNGNNKYASRPVIGPPKKKIIAKIGGGIVLKTNSQGPASEVSSNLNNLLSSSTTTQSYSDSLVNLQARLACIDGVDEDDEDKDFKRKERSEADKRAHDHEKSGKIKVVDGEEKMDWEKSRDPNGLEKREGEGFDNSRVDLKGGVNDLKKRTEKERSDGDYEERGIDLKEIDEIKKFLESDNGFGTPDEIVSRSDEKRQRIDEEREKFKKDIDPQLFIGKSNEIGKVDEDEKDLRSEGTKNVFRDHNNNNNNNNLEIEIERLVGGVGEGVVGKGSDDDKSDRKDELCRLFDDEIVKE